MLPCALQAQKLKKAAEKELGQFYPTDSDGARPIAYLWARTVRCESPNCGAEIPLMRSMWLCKKANRRRALRPNVVREKGKPPRVEFEIFTPANESEVKDRTVQRAKATCLCCHSTLSADRVRAQLRDQQGGADVVFDKNKNRIGGSLLLAVVLLKSEEIGRHYRLPSQLDYQCVYAAKDYADKLSKEVLDNGLKIIPDEPTPAGGGSGAGRAFSVQKYGMYKFSDLFTARQKATLATLVKLNLSIQSEFSTLNALVISRLADRLASLVGWDTGGEKLSHVFNRQILPIVWDFAEGSPFANATGSYENVIHQIEGAVQGLSIFDKQGQVHISDATESPLPNESANVWFTDPPYYDAVPYSDLSDFFFVWLKRALPKNTTLHDPYDKNNLLTPKLREAVQDEVKIVDGKPKDKIFFENKMAGAFSEGRRILKDDGIGSVVFAHKTTEGWEALLSGMIRGGWIITGSWPIATERANRLRSQDSAALATSVHLICRPRSENAAIGDWTQVSRELPRKVGDWMQRLQNEGVSGADLVFACIGPALEIYSRYSKVVDAEDREIPLGGDPESREPHLRGFLAYVWEVVGRLALEQVLSAPTSGESKDATNALEEDARLTALFLWTKGSASPQGEKSKVKSAEFDEEPEAEDDEEDTPKKKSKGGFALPFDVVRRIAQPLGIHLPEWEHRIIETDKGVVTLLSVKDRARQLFGEEGASSFASDLESNPSKSIQMSLFAEAESAPKIRAKRKSKKDGEVALDTKREATTLDRLHAAMLLQKGGQTTALRALLQSESERGSDFMRLANALSALYPRESEEKRLLDALLVNVRR